MNTRLTVCLSLAAGLLSLTGCGGGSASQEMPPTVTDLHVTLTGQAPSWTAFQDGSGQWVTAGAAASGTYHVNDANGRYGYAVGYVADGAKQIVLWQGTLAEQPSLAFAVPGATPAPISLSFGNPTGINSGEKPDPYFGSGNSSLDYTANGFTLTCAPDSADLVMILRDSGNFTPLRAWIGRGRSYTANANIGSLNLVSAAPMASTPVNVTGLGSGETLELLGTWYTSGGTQATLGYNLNASTPSTVPILPVSMLGTGEIQDIYALVESANGWKLSSAFFHDAGSVSLRMPPALTGSVTIANQNVAAHWNAVNLATWYYAYLSQSATSVYASAALTPGWLGTGNTFTYNAPDFTAIASGWTIALDQPFSWSLRGSATSYPTQPFQGPTRNFMDNDWEFITELSGTVGSQAAKALKPSPWKMRSLRAEGGAQPVR